MGKAFEAYPELVCLDATYKLLNLGLPVFLMLCEDSNGQSEIIALSMIASEDTTSIRWMLDTFKNLTLNGLTLEWLWQIKTSKNEMSSKMSFLMHQY